MSGAGPSFPHLADLLVEGAPVGAGAHLFRYELQSAVVTGGEPRLVPVPVRVVPTDDGDLQMQPPTIERVDAVVPPGCDVLVVEAVEPGSSASRAGLRRGDLVLQVAGRSVHGRVVVLPSPGRTATSASGPPRLASVTAFNPMTHLHGREVNTLFDLDIVRSLTREGDELSAEFEAYVPDSAADDHKSTVRRTARDFEPALGSLLETLSGPLPAEGVDLLVVQDGARRSTHLAGPEPAGLGLTTTCYPVVCSQDNRAGALPLVLHGLPADSWLLVLRAPGFEDLRVPVRLQAGRTTLVRVDLLPGGTSPPGFVYVAPGPYLAGGADVKDAWPPEERWLDGYWISRTEVTVGEYLEFLNDDETLAAIRLAERTRELLRVPREFIINRVARSTCRALWAKEDGRYVTDEDPRRPIKDISCEDADAYCRWRTARSVDGWLFRLPSEDEWEKAARGVDGRACPWGERPDFSFCKSDSAHDLTGALDATWERLIYEPVTRPTRDESPYGMRDAAGNVLEWCIGAPFTGLSFRRPWRGGHARGPDDDDLLCCRRADGYPDHVGSNDGFRIVAWRLSRSR